MGRSSKHSGEPSKYKFAKLIMDAIHKAGETRKITYEQDAFLLRGEGKSGSIISLSNLYQEYCSAPGYGREEIIKGCMHNWFAHLLKMPEKFEGLKPDLLPALRDRSYFELTPLHLEVEGCKAAALPYEVLNEHFGVGLVYNLPDSLRFLPQEYLDELGVSFDEAMEVARQNLTKLKYGFIGLKSGEGVYLSASKDSYNPSRLILTDIIRRLRVKGDPIAMIPNRDSLIVTGADDEAGLAAMVAMVKDGLKSRGGSRELPCGSKATSGCRGSLILRTPNTQSSGICTFSLTVRTTPTRRRY